MTNESKHTRQSNISLNRNLLVCYMCMRRKQRERERAARKGVGVGGVWGVTPSFECFSNANTAAHGCMDALMKEHCFSLVTVVCRELLWNNYVHSITPPTAHPIRLRTIIATISQMSGKFPMKRYGWQDTRRIGMAE